MFTLHTSPILHLLVRFYDAPKGLLVKNEGFVDILMYVQNTGITAAL